MHRAGASSKGLAETRTLPGAAREDHGVANKNDVFSCTRGERRREFEGGIGPEVK